MLSVVLITKNEAANLERCLNSVKSIADEIILVDSGSTDQTLAIAKQFGSKIFHRDFTQFSEQKNFALSLATKKWIFLIDADEALTDALSQEISTVIHSQNQETAYSVKRTTYFFGKKIRFSGTQHDAPIRLFPRGKIRYEQPVHEEIKTELPVQRLNSRLLHFTTRDLKHYEQKLDGYIPLEIETLRLQKRPRSLVDQWIRPLGKFFHQYFIQLGILDGRTGFVFAFLSARYTWIKYNRYCESC